MRDLILYLLLALAAVYALRSPWIGIIGWTIVSIMNPHNLGYSIRYAPVAMVMALITLIGVLIAPASEKSFPWRREPIILILLMCWFCITLLFSFSVEGSYEQWKKVMKIDLMTLVALYVIHSRKHIEVLVWALVVSIGFYGIKGGLFTLMTGGQFRVWGPEGTYIEGNNEVALAIIIVIPLVRYLQMQVTVRWLKLALFISMILMAAAALGSHSRGALLAIVAMVTTMWWRSKNKLPGLIISVVVGAVLLDGMSEQWFSRMDTIRNYQEDSSAMGRINTWWMAFNLAKSNFFGGGFDIYNFAVFSMYAPDPSSVHAAHSIYFQILGEHGFIGLIIFLFLFGYTWATAGFLRKAALTVPQARWVVDLASMCQVALAGYAVGGAFLSLAYFDLPYYLVVLMVAARVWFEKKAWVNDVATAGESAGGQAKKPVAARLRSMF